MLQTPQKTSRRPARPMRSSRRYVALMAPSAMITYLAHAAIKLRTDAGRKNYHIAAAITDGVNPSTVHRFEKGRWPENADRMIDLYASDLEVEPIEIWALALELWRADEGELTAPGGGGAPPAPEGELARRIADRPPSARGPRRRANPRAADATRDTA